MDCRKKRTFFNLFEVSACSNCRYQKRDENIIIGNNNISIYHLFQNCPHLEIAKDGLYFHLKKLKQLLLDAIIYQDQIFLIFLEDFRLADYFEVLDKVLDSDLSIQIITD